MVGSVKVRGRVEDDLAELTVELELSLLVPGAAWVPLGIDSQIVSSAREGERELELRVTGEGKWEARIEGQGAHRLRLDLKRPVKVSPDRKRLELAIPEAPSTYLELDVPRAVHDVELGSGESIGKTLLPGGKGTRLSAHLAPRSSLALDWSDEANSGPAPPRCSRPRWRSRSSSTRSPSSRSSSWAIRCVRGMARKLEIRLDAQDVVSRLKLGDQYFGARNREQRPDDPPGRAAEARRGPESLHGDTATAADLGPEELRVFGFPLSNAAEQSGAIGITQSANLWVNVTTTQGLRRIDPRELPTALRANPGTSSAYQFLDQPFKLNFAVESSPPLYRAEATTRLDLDADMARSSTSIEVQRVRGRLFEIQVAIPPGLQLLSVGPPDLVESATPTQGRERAAGEDPSSPTEQVLTIQLTPAARDQRSLTLRLRGQQRIGRGWTGEARALLASRRGLHRHHGDALRGSQRDLRGRRRPGRPRWLHLPDLP